MNNPVDLLRLDNVHYKVSNGQNQLHILKNITMSIAQGTSVAITGRSGSGKTSLLNIMAGLELPTSGNVYYHQQAINRLDEDARATLRANKVGFIFQSFQLLPNLTALENIMLPLEISQQQAVEDKARHWLEVVGLLERANHYPNQLSGGEQQRVAIARAFSIQPELLFADEPTGNLDKSNAQNIIDLLFELNKKHASTLIIVTHDDLLAKHCQQHWPLDDGVLQC